jgi:hypothetical protein
MKKAILKGVKVGAIAGFSGAVINAFLVLVAAELSWPASNPQKIDVFNVDFVSSYLIPLIMGAPIWLVPPILIGSVTASIFGFVHARFDLPKIKFVLVCGILCTIITVIYFPIIQYLFFGQYVSHIFVLLFSNPLIEMSLLFFPGIIYLLAGIIVSKYLYEKLSR